MQFGSWRVVRRPDPFPARGSGRRACAQAASVTGLVSSPPHPSIIGPVPEMAHHIVREHGALERTPHLNLVKAQVNIRCIGSLSKHIKETHGW
jgi:hypothetical protein